MKISTSYMFDRSMAQMSSVQNDLSYTQAQVSAAKQVLNPSDAPDQAAAIQRLKSVMAKQDSYGKTLTTLQDRLQNEDSTLQSMSNLLIRAKEISVESANDTMSPANRQALGVELQGLRDQMLSMANAQDSKGNYLFSGSRLNKAAYVQNSAGEINYQGDQTRIHVQVGDQRSVALNRSGTDAFVSVQRTDAQGQQTHREFFGAIDDLITGMNKTDRTAIQRGINDMDTLLQGVGMAQASVGTDLNVVEQQTQVIDDTKLTLKTTLSNVEDLDMAAAITKMNKQMLSLQASQSSFAKISQLNLFNFIK